MLIYNGMQNIYETFEFNKILLAISEHSKTEVGKEKIEDLKMLPSFDDVSNKLEEVKEMMSIISRYSPMPISNSASALYLISLAKKTLLLTPRDLNLIAEDVLTSQQLVKYSLKLGDDYPLIKDKISKFFDLTPLEKEIHRVITNALTIADNASPLLKEIRGKIRKLENQLQQKVASLSLTYSQFLNDDNATIRDGHFVLPVKTSEKNKVLGIVYDVSDSGATTFIEPMEIVQINNTMTALKVEENEECRRILKELTGLVLLQEKEILNNNLIIGDLDFISAKALYANENGYEIALMSKNPVIDLVNARHPLIDKNKVVANSYHLDEEKRIVIISGPNAGGKTVSLKTVGICVLMHQCGLAIPCQKATLSYFNNIYVDIGDNQSLSDNLSTFSAHMSHISEITNVAKGKDLVLLDELGTGTDPKEGESLALSITKYLEKKNSFAMISSHFDALKEYAFLSPNLENSSMEFDEEKLSPTYHFLLGVPGHSYALDVAKRYGVREDIIQESKDYLTDNSQTDASTLIEILQKKIEEATKLEAELKKEQEDFDRRNKKLINDEKLLAQRRENLLKDVEEEKESLIQDAKDEIDMILSQLNNNQDLKIHEIIALKKDLDNLENNPETIIYNEEIGVDDYVSIPSLGLSGKVIRIKGKKAHINADNGMSFDVEIEKLHKIDSPKVSSTKPKQTQQYDEVIKLNVGLELNIIGLRVDEAKLKLEKYIDDCRVKHFTTVRIIHGFGSGALRKMTHDYLKTLKDVTFRPGDMNEGAGGATVVTFKK